jgi:hypothetical protein
MTEDNDQVIGIDPLGHGAWARVERARDHFALLEFGLLEKHKVGDHTVWRIGDGWLGPCQRVWIEDTAIMASGKRSCLGKGIGWGYLLREAEELVGLIGKVRLIDPRKWQRAWGLRPGLDTKAEAHRVIRAIFDPLGIGASFDENGLADALLIAAYGLLQG